MTALRLAVLAASFVFLAPPPASAGVPAKASSAEEKGDEKPAVGPEADLPDGIALMARFRELCGYEKLRETKLQHVTGSFSMPAQGIEATMEAWLGAPNLSLVTIDIPGIGVTQEGFDGTHAWSMDPMQGPLIKRGAAAAEAAFKADYLAVLDPERYLEVETLEKVDFHGRPAWKVRLKPRVGSDSIAYFDVESGLEVGQEESVTTPMGSIAVVIRNSEYKEFNGMRFPTRIEQTTMGMTQIISIAAVEFDVGSASFELPPAVKALLEDPETPPPE
jgi:hypothetical protein